MQIPGVHIETLQNPARYTHAQIDKATAIAQGLQRGKLVLAEAPKARRRSPALLRGMRLCPLQRGDFVTYLARPEWGSGLLMCIEPNGLLRVRFADAVPVYEGEFHAQELEMAFNTEAAA